MSNTSTAANAGIEHDIHAHDEHKQSFISKYVFSMDHKVISKQFLFTGLLMGLIGMTMSVLFRLQLAWPDKEFPILHTLLGRWAKDGHIDPGFYMALVTMHGTIMVFF